MTTNAPFSGNPADKYSLQGVMRKVLDKFLQKKIDNQLPAVVIAYDDITNMACVQPLITVVTTDGQQVARAQIAAVPVYQISAGGYIIRFPVKAGDTGWIEANDRDISLYMQTGKQSPPNTQRKHSFRDGIFKPQTLWDNVTVADPTVMTIQNYAGTVSISLSETAISIDAPTSISITAPTVNINASTALNLNSPLVTISGVFVEENTDSVSTPLDISRAIVATGNVTGNGISLDSHTHGGVTTGGGDTTGPI